MAIQAGFAMDSMSRMNNNRALLGKKAPFEILKANGFIKTTGEKFNLKKLTPVQKRLMRMKVNSYRKTEKKKLILTSALTLLITTVVIVMSIQLTKLIF